MRRVTACILVSIMALAGSANAGRQPEPKKIKTLIITGRDVNAHKWRETTPALRKILEDTKKFEVLVCEDPAILESATALEKYDLIVQNYYNWKQPPISDKAKENLSSYIKGGKGFVVFHFSSLAWKDWPEWRKICGRNWVSGTSGHGPFGKFSSKVVKDHPITRSIPKEFETEDELYAKLQGDTKINVLVQAYSEWSKQIEPLAFTHDYGKGRVYYHCYGHTAEAVRVPPVARLWAQGCEWAATGDVK